MRTMVMLVMALALASGCKKTEKQDAAGGAGSAATGSAATGSAATGSAPGDTATGSAPTGSAAGDTGAGAGATPTGDGLKLTRKAPAVGDKRGAEETMTTAFTLTPPGKQPIPMTMVKTENKQVEVLGVEGDQLQKIKVTYTAKGEQRTMANKPPENKPSVLHGKSYVVWREGGAFKSTTDGGAAVSPAEAKELEKEWKNDLDGDDPMERWLLERTWKIGEKVALTPEQLAEFQKRNNDGKAVSGAMTLTSVDGNIATFTIDMDVRQQAGTDTLAMPMVVTVKVDTRTNWPQEMRMTGTLEGPMKGMQAKGTVEGATKYTY